MYRIGWYAENAMWKRNAGILGAGLALAAIYIFRSSAQYERRYNAGPVPVPSQRWSTHTEEDDPQYYEKLTSWKKSGPGFFSRLFQTKDDFKEE